MSVPNAVLILYFFASAERCVRAGEHLQRLGSLERAGRKRLGHFVGERLNAQPDALLGDQFGGWFVHQVAVFDALHAGGDRAPDRLGV